MRESSRQIVVYIEIRSFLSRDINKAYPLVKSKRIGAVFAIACGPVVGWKNIRTGAV